MGKSAFGLVQDRGLSRVPNPPMSISAFRVSRFLEQLLLFIACPWEYKAFEKHVGYSHSMVAGGLWVMS
jgi:hypothetical protein